MMNVLNIRTWADARAFIHVLAPVLAGAMVASGYVDENAATEIVTLVLAIFSPAIAMVNSVNGFRTWLYGVLGAASAILISLDVFTANEISIWFPVLTLVLGSAVAAANTPTTLEDYVTVPASDIISRVRAENAAAPHSVTEPGSELPHVPPTGKE